MMNIQSCETSLLASTAHFSSLRWAKSEDEIMQICTQSLLQSTFSFFIIHRRHQVKQRRRVGTCNHHPRRTYFGTPPSEALVHVKRHSEFPLRVTHQQLQI